jgi:hypothetical protein
VFPGIKCHTKHLLPTDAVSVYLCNVAALKDVSKRALQL